MGTQQQEPKLQRGRHGKVLAKPKTPKREWPRGLEED